LAQIRAIEVCRILEVELFVLCF